MLDPVAILAEIVSAELQSGSKPAVCMILGAGASISSGGETFEQLKKRLIEQFDLTSEIDGEEIKAINGSTGFEDFFEHLFKIIKSPQTRTKLLRDAFPERLQPSDGYVCVALLCAVGALRSIITTNFDRYLESATRSLGVDQHVYVVYAGNKYDRGLISSASMKKTIIYKIHGDYELGVYNITDEELNDDEYPEKVREVAIELLGLNHVVVSGYSGSEKRMASLLKNDSGRTDREVFWVSPSSLGSDKPLYLSVKDKLVQADSNSDAMRFDPAMKRLLGSLDSSLFDGRTGLFRSYAMYADDVSSHTEKTLRIQDYLNIDNPLYVHRKKVLRRIRETIDDGRNLVAIVGPSGYGKSTLMPALVAGLKDDSSAMPTAVLLSVGGDLRANITIEEHLAEVLGLSQLLTPSLVLMNSDLRRRKRRLVVIIDAIDQARSSIDEIKLLFRDIADFHARCLSEGVNRIGLLISCRSEIWQAMCAPTNRYRIDISRTTEVFVDSYDEIEAKAAFLAYASHNNVQGKYQEINPDSRAMMREPILLRIICKAYENQELPETLELHRVFDSFLQSCFDGHRDYNALAFLESLAIKWLDPRIARDGVAFGDLPTDEETLGDNIDVALRAGIIRRTFLGHTEAYTFFHERVLELFMTRYLLREYEGPLKNIRFTHADLTEGLEHAADSKHSHNVFRMFLTNPRCQKALGNCLAGADEWTESFLAECVIESSQVNPGAFSDRYLDWFLSASRPRIRAVLIQAAANSSTARNRLWEVLNRLEEHETELFLTASYYLLDGLADQLGRGEETSLSAIDLAELIHHSPGRELRSIGFVLYLLARRAPERSNKNSWKTLYLSAQQLICQLAQDVNMPSEESLRLLADRFAPRYVFNGSASTFDIFFQKDSSMRRGLIGVIHAIIENVGPIPPKELDAILFCADESQSWLEKILLQPLLSFMACRDISRYRETIEKLLDSAKNASQADFCSGSVAYQVAANDYFDHEFSFRVNAHCVDQRPDFLATERSYSELFNPIGTYGFTFPRFHPGKPVDLFQYALNKFRDANDEHLICRVLHALRQALALYPSEGLATLETIVDHPSKLVRERLVLVLEEGYLVEPGMVSRFVWRHDKTFSEDERHRILRSGKNHIHIHPVTILEWGRVYRFLLWASTDSDIWRDAMLRIASARSFTDLLQAFIALATGRHTKKPDIYK